MYMTQYATPGYVRKISAGIITTRAGNSNSATDGAVGAAATSIALYYPWGLSGDSVGNLYVAEYSGNRVRQIQTSTGYTQVFPGYYPSEYITFVLFFIVSV